VPQPLTPLAAFGTQGVPGALPKPPGQTITTVSGERIKNEPALTIQDLLQESPGVSFKQGTGPRDLGISIRGSNARNGFGIRNIVVLEDGFDDAEIVATMRAICDEFEADGYRRISADLRHRGLDRMALAVGS
jgi:hypothetical protein